MKLCKHSNSERFCIPYFWPCGQYKSSITTTLQHNLNTYSYLKILIKYWLKYSILMYMDLSWVVFHTPRERKEYDQGLVPVHLWLDLDKERLRKETKSMGHIKCLLHSQGIQFVIKCIVPSDLMHLDVTFFTPVLNRVYGNLHPFH